VDHKSISVGNSAGQWDAVCAAELATLSIPRRCTAGARLSTDEQQAHTAADLHAWRFSTLSTAPMTTSLRYRSDMTQDVCGWAGRTPAKRGPQLFGDPGLRDLALSGANPSRDYDGVTTTAWVIGAA
jgi:hypothetical protein